MIQLQYKDNEIAGKKKGRKRGGGWKRNEKILFFTQLLKFSELIVLFKSYGMSKMTFKCGQCNQICGLQEKTSYKRHFGTHVKNGRATVPGWLS